MQSGLWRVARRVVVLALTVVGLGAFVATTSAQAFGLGISRFRDDISPANLNLRGSRVDITTPGAFNILNPNFGL